jgi:hypothetical protein
MKKHKDGVIGSRSPRWAFMSRMVIPSKRPEAHEGDFYLSRLRILQTPWFGILLHHIGEPDNERDPHDHPWNFVSFIVKGGYREELHIYMGLLMHQRFFRYWKRFTWHKMDIEKAHRIIEVDPGTITLIFTGRRSREWGFWTPSGWVKWNEYLPAQEVPPAPPQPSPTRTAGP